jgi:hypothetical protein
MLLGVQANFSLDEAQANLGVAAAQCSADRDAFVDTLLPSITAFEIIGSDAFTSATGPLLEAPISSDGLTTIPIPGGEGGTSNMLVQLSGPGIVASEGARSFSYSGGIFGATDSRASFSIIPRSAESGTPGNFSGFVIKDLSDEKDSSIAASRNWYFYEPVKPLLARVLAARPEASLPCSESNLNDIFSDADEFDNTSIIVYEVRDTEFDIDLDPYNVDEFLAGGTGEGEIALDVQSAAQSDSGSFLTLNRQSNVNLIIVADSKYVELMGGATAAKNDIDALMNILLNGNSLNFYEIFGANVSISFVGSEIWETDTTPPNAKIMGTGPGAQFNADGTIPNAYQLLCDFIENVEHQDDLNNSIVHLFTGFDLAKFPKEPPSQARIVDSGDGICPAGCGGDGRAIVGLAQGIGGVGNAGQNNCGEFPYNSIDKFNPAGYHSVSQHRPKTDLNGFNSKFDGTLLQRWVLVAHEIGHTFGALHADDSSTKIKSVMNSSIDGQLNYYLNSVNAGEINN